MNLYFKLEHNCTVQVMYTCKIMKLNLNKLYISICFNLITSD